MWNVYREISDTNILEGPWVPLHDQLFPLSKGNHHPECINHSFF